MCDIIKRINTFYNLRQIVTVSDTNLHSHLWSGHVARRVIGMLIGVSLILVAAVSVGPKKIIQTLVGVKPRFVALSVGMIAIALIVWGCSLWKVLRSLGANTIISRACWLFLGSIFLNKLTPFGQAGGDIPSGYLLAKDCNIRTETGVAAITSVNTINKISGIGLGLIGLITLDGVLFTRPGHAAVIWSVISVGAGGLIFIGWRFRWQVIPIAIALITPPISTITDWLPVVSIINQEAVKSRIEGFVHAIERIGVGQTAIWVVVLGITGQLAVSVALWAVIRSLGLTVPVAAAVVTVPVARVAAITPTPGGMGAVEVTLAGVLVIITGIKAVQAGTAALIYQLVAFWLPLFPGGVIVGTVFLDI